MRSSGRNSNRNYRGAGNSRDDRQRAGRPRPEERRYGAGGGPARGGQGGAPARGGEGGAPRGGQGGGAPRGGAGASGGGRGTSGGGRGASGGPRGAAGGPRGAAGGPRGTSGSSRGTFGDTRGTSGGTGSTSAGSRGTTGGPDRGRAGGKGAAPGGPRRGERRPAPARSREYDAQLEERNRERHTKPAVRLPKTFGDPEGERLQKVLARAGMGSRRACEELIDQGRVEVNGRRVREQGRRVDPDRDEIKVDGLTVAAQSHLFFALNKPAGVVSSMEDPEGRQCLGDYVQNRETRLFHVGRLDTETEGLILLTNHGELAHRLTHPKYGVTKTYLAAVQGPIPRDLGRRLREGIDLEDGFARADDFRVVQNTGNNYLVEVSLHEGRKHIVRRMLSEAGFPVDRLVRTHFGPIALGDQKSGWLRRMTNTEVGRLMREVDL
ncbi:pseudouridine synthase [Streptomyces sp. DSM 44917]|uniref:Pseudouridine synthase n=1 Tax=Streptomyces boetiae TaxID=3075541 RepID=A0ABU2LFN1_9ACTN|nr:pseudouridine synthase [Streptomyces sp. DSM 44917]MDT0310389.1 pseudouridine synthase [Streptomyces sp. DSM 44917]